MKSKTLRPTVIITGNICDIMIPIVDSADCYHSSVYLHEDHERFVKECIDVIYSSITAVDNSRSNPLVKKIKPKRNKVYYLDKELNITEGYALKPVERVGRNIIYKLVGNYYKDTVWSICFDTKQELIDKLRSTIDNV